MFKYFIYKFGQFCVTHLPIQVAYRLAVFMSDMHYLLSPNDRKAVTNNLKIILESQESIKRKTREVFRNFGKYLVEFFRMAKKLDHKYINDNITIQNLKVLDEVRKAGKGAILLTAHIGNWELGAVVLSMLGYPVVAIALPHKERPVNDLFNKQRQSKGVTVVPAHLAIRRCIATLKRNEVVALVADRDFSNNGEEIEFLRQKTLIPKGAAIFSERTGAPIVPIFLVRNKDDEFTLIVEDPIYPPSEGIDHNDHKTTIEIVKKYAQIIESKIIQFPTQWLMFRQFWLA